MLSLKQIERVCGSIAPMAINEIDFRKIDLNLLVVFHALHREGSVSRAAQRLYLGASAVSMSLRRLRELFADELFVRDGVRMMPTARAEQLAAPIEDILAAAHRLVYPSDGFEPLHAERVFRLGASEACEAGTVAALLAELRSLAPSARLVVRPLDHLHATELLDAGEIELAVGYVREVPARHASERLCHHDFVCMFDPQQLRCTLPIGLDDYLAHAHVLVSQRGDLEGVVDARLRELGHAREVLASTSRLSVIPSWLKRAPLIATLAEDVAVELALHHGLACSPLPFALDGYDVQMVWHRRLQDDAAAAWFRELVRRVAAAAPLQRAQEAVG